MIANINGTKDQPMPIFDLRTSRNIDTFFKRKDITLLEKRGMASPDHVLRTKGKPILLKKSEIDKKSILNNGHSCLL